MSDSLWFTTRSTLFREGDAAWEEIVRYEQPLRRLMARRYGRRLSPDQRDDLVQDILIEIKETLTTSFDRSRGRFRALLQTVVARRVVDEFRRSRSRPLAPVAEEELQAPAPEELDALDLEAALVEAVSACRDHFSGGPSKDFLVLHALTGRLVHGLSAIQIAKQEEVSRDRISRLLAKGRDVVFRHLLAPELGLDLHDPALDSCVAGFKRMLRQPIRSEAELGRLESAELAERLDTFWRRFQAALPRFAGDLTAAGRELAHGVRLVLGEEDREQ